MTEWSKLKRKGESRMRELDEMISRLRNRGIKVEKVKYPKQTLSEKNGFINANSRSKQITEILTAILSHKKIDCKTSTVYFGTAMRYVTPVLSFSIEIDAL